MSDFYSDQEKILVSVDCIILGFKDSKLNVLVFKRKFNPLKGKKSLMGGFVKASESISDTASRVLSEYTGLDNVFMEQVATYGDVERDTGERVISIVYYSLIDVDAYDERLQKKHNASWMDVNNVGDLVFDHNKMLADAIKQLQRRSATRPIGFNLLPENFTIPQLQSLYEAIYQRGLDKRNFRKKLFEMDVLEKLNIKDKSSSRKGAFYYRFNIEKYNRLLQNGDFFSL